VSADAVLARLVAWGEAEETIRGLILLGSRARTDTPADAWSDTDVVVFTTDADRWLREAGWVTSLGEPVLTFVEETGLSGLMERRVLFDDAVDLDMVITPVERADDVLSADGALPVLARGHRVLLDKDGRFAGLAERVAQADPWAIRAAAPWPPDPTDVANLIGDYWYHCVWTTKKLRRGEVATALGCLNGHMARLTLRFVEWQAKARSDGAAQTWFDGRYLERWALPETVEALGGTVARYDPTDVAPSLLASMELFAALGREVAAAASVSYPEASEAWVRRWVEQALSEG
jgi:aminoglycoside 6-adenylyltransferase